MRILVAALVASCVPVVPAIETYEVDATSARLVSADDSTAMLAVTPDEAASLVLEKLGARGFTLVETKQTPAGRRLKLSGNRDYAAVGQTIGSVFYVWLEPVAAGTRVKIIGKPTAEHRDACPAFDGDPACVRVKVTSLWGMRGVEESQVIRGVFAELALATEPAPDTESEPHLTLRGCGGALRFASQHK